MTVTSEPKSVPKKLTRESVVDSLKGVRLLGSVCTWDPGRSDKTFTQVRDALTKAGFDPSIARELAPRSAFARAAKKLSEERVIDIVREDGDEVVFQFSKKNFITGDEGRQIEYRKENFVRLNKLTGKITCKNDALRERAQKEVDRCMEMRTTSDITRIVQRLFEKQADLIPIRNQGGVYFVPQMHMEVALQIGEFLKNFGGEIIAFPVPEGTQYGDRSVQTSLSDYLDILVNDLKEAIDGFSQSTRPDTIQHTADKINQARFKVEAYAVLLKDKAKGLLEEVDTLNGVLVEKIKELTDEREKEPVNAQSNGKAFSVGEKLLSVLSDTPKQPKQIIAEAKIPIDCHDYAHKFLNGLKNKGVAIVENGFYRKASEEI